MQLQFVPFRLRNAINTNLKINYVLVNNIRFAHEDSI